MASYSNENGDQKWGNNSVLAFTLTLTNVLFVMF